MYSFESITDLASVLRDADAVYLGDEWLLGQDCISQGRAVGAGPARIKVVQIDARPENRARARAEILAFAEN